MFELSARADSAIMSSMLYGMVLQYLRMRNPVLQLHSHLAISPDPMSLPLSPMALFFDHVVIHRHRYKASNRASTDADSLIAIRHPVLGNTQVGELQDIIALGNDKIGYHRFGRVRWLRAFDMAATAAVWNDL